MAPARRRPGNAGSNAADDHLEVIDLVLAQLPKPGRDRPLLVGADTGGATHALTGHLRQRDVRFSVSLPADERVRAAVLAVPADAWQPAVDAHGQPRLGAEVAELATLELSRSSSPTSPTRCGHLGAAAAPPCPRRDRIRCAKATGLRNLPFDLLRRNQVWMELVLAPRALRCWAQILLLEGDLKVAEPKTLCYRLLQVAARVVRHARRLIIHLQRSWPRAAAFARLRALPLCC